MTRAAGVPRRRSGGARGADRTSVGPLPRSERLARSSAGPFQNCVVTTLNRRWRSRAEGADGSFERLTQSRNLRSCRVLPLAARWRPSSRAATASLALLLHFCAPYPAATDRWKRVLYEYGAMAQSWRFGFRD